MSERLTQSQMILDALLTGIREGKYAHGEQLPSLRSLSYRFKTSVSTVRSAFQKLMNIGEISSYQGRGYYVSNRPFNGERRHILIFNRLDSIYGEMIEDILRIRHHQPEIIVSVESINQPADYLQSRIEQLIKEGLDTIFCNCVSSPNMDFLEKYLDKVVVYGFFNLPSLNTHLSFLPGVYSDWIHGGYIGVSHLISRGCRDILMVFTSDGYIQAESAHGAELAVSDSGEEIRISKVYEYCMGNETQFEFSALKEYFHGCEGRKVGVFCFSFALAVRVSDWVKSNGYHLGEDVLLMGYYDSPEFALFKPGGMTGISICQQEMSEALLKMFMGRQRRYVVIKPRLVIRGTTGGNIHKQ